VYTRMMWTKTILLLRKFYFTRAHIIPIVYHLQIKNKTHYPTKREASSSLNALDRPIRRLSFAVSNCRRYARHPPVVASAFSSGHQNDALTRRFLFTIVVVIVVVVVVVVIIVVIVVVVPTPAPRSRGNFYIKIPRRSRLKSPRRRKHQWLPRHPVGSSIATVVHLQNDDVR